MERACPRQSTRAAHAAWALLFLSSPVLAQQRSPAPVAPDSRAGTASSRAGVGPSRTTSSAPADAKSEAEEAQKLYDKNDMKGAVERYQRAYDLSRDRTLLVRIAACYKNMGMFTRALEAAQEYLGSATTDVDRSRAREFVEGLAELTSPLWVESNEPGATVYVDGNEVALTPMQKPVLVDIGVQQVRVVKAGFGPATATVRAPGFGREVRLRIDLALEKQVGALSVLAAPGQSVWIDGKLVARGRWEGVVAPGPHAVRVTSPGMQDYDERVTVVDGEHMDVRVKLVPESTPTARADTRERTPWLLVTGVGLGAAVLTAGAIAGGYYLFKSDQHEPKPPAGGSMGDFYLGLILGGVR